MINHRLVQDFVRQYRVNKASGSCFPVEIQDPVIQLEFDDGTDGPHFGPKLGVVLSSLGPAPFWEGVTYVEESCSFAGGPS